MGVSQRPVRASVFLSQFGFGLGAILSLGVSLVLASWLERVGSASIHKPSGCFSVPCQFALVCISWLFCRDNGMIVPFSC